MNKVKRRTVSTAILVGFLLIGLGFYVVKLFINGDKWSASVVNQSVYSGGVLTAGTIYDRNGLLLFGSSDDGTYYYADDPVIREATLHAVGDAAGNIGTGALSVFASELIGYNILDGTYSLSGEGQSLNLTIDANLNAVAYEALDGRKGVVAVYNYETGDVLCMVSSPTYDPADPPEITDDDEEYEGVYINRFLSSVYTPGSTFKLVTAAAAIENIPDIYSRTFTCEGSLNVLGDLITCTGVHGEITFEEALAYSCNTAFAQIALELGGKTLDDYVDQFQLTSRLEISGVRTAKGNFDIAEDGSANLAWSGVGQYNDLVCPAAMLRFVGAIANGGTAVTPNLIEKVSNSWGLPIGLNSFKSTERLMSKSTADALSDMMNYNVAANYGADNFPGLELYAKSGTAEVGGGEEPNAWFVGFVRNEGYPLAFVVVVENGGGGTSVAGPIANEVLQSAVFGS